MENEGFSRNMMGVGAQQPEGMQQPEAAQQPVTIQQSETMQQPEGIQQPELKKKSKKWLGWVLALIGVAIIAVVVAVLVVVPGSNNIFNEVTWDKVRSYCEENKLSVDEGVIEEPEAKYLLCQSEISDSGEYTNDIRNISFTVYEQPVAEIGGFEKEYEFLKSTGLVLEESDDYKKIYLGSSDSGVAYLIIGEKNYMSLVATNNEIARKVLIDLGYPDRNWGSDSELEITSSALQSAQRNTQRREDMAVLATGLVQYQTNNRGQLPEGPAYWEGQVGLDCADGNVACEFVREYLNQSGDLATNEYLSPIGEPYNIYITGNWAKNGGIDTIIDGEDVGLVVEGEGYTVNDSANDTIYVIAGGQCDGEKVLNSGRERAFAVMLRLEGDEIYCTSN